jgi:hypothetical protein
MKNFLDYINDKINEDKVCLNLKKDISKDINIKEQVKIKKPKFEDNSAKNVAKNILEGMSEEITPYSSSLLIQSDENGGAMSFNRNVSEDTKHASLLLMGDE